MDDITFDIYVISRLTHGYYARELAALGITMAQFPYIMGIIGNAGLSQEKLSRLLRMGKSTTAEVIRQLLDKKLIRREPDPVDRRNFRLYATEKALALQPEISAVIGKCNSLISDGLSEDEKKVFYSLLSRVRQKTETGLDGRNILPDAEQMGDRITEQE
ncbi:MAG: MarR family transcriptional regulator [Lentisphaerae bacterium]|nr:MarR family transcriptional regulator [Lentisphaerota bacterium]